MPTSKTIIKGDIKQKCIVEKYLRILPSTHLQFSPNETTHKYSMARRKVFTRLEKKANKLSRFKQTVLGSVKN